MFLARLSVSGRFLLVLVIGFAFQAGISIVSLRDLKRSLVQDRVTEVKHLLEVAYSDVVYYHEQARQGRMSDAQARAAAADALRSLHYDGTNYFFVWDLNGTSIAHGAQPALEGKTFINSPDAERNPVVAYMVARLLEVARSPDKEGVSTYRIPKRGEKVPLEKIAYSKLFEPWGWSIGTGAYVDDIEEAFSARALSLLWEFLGLTLLASGITYFIGRDLALAMGRLAGRVVSVARGELDGDVPDVGRRDEVGAMARALLVLRDTSREAAELRLDQLTGLPTRKLLIDHLKRATALSARSGNYGAVMLVDMDNFKALNDTHGHDFGDLMLREVARRLSVGLRKSDTVARLGGDEFVVVLVDIARSATEAATAAERVGTKLLEVLGRPYLLGRVTHASTASIGITLFQGAGASVEDLLKQADLAMYRSKESGRNAWRFFDPQMEATIRERTLLEGELRVAIPAGQFRLYYQPQVGSDGNIKGAEALVRWEHPRLGLVAPSEFIPMAEETGLILPLGRLVLETACRQMAAWARQPLTAALQIAVNVSARQFQQPDFAEQVIEALRTTGADPRRLTLELTESLFVNNIDDVTRKMELLKRQGIRFALDDFGTGYSSLHYLKRLPLDQIKIDRSFVRDVLTDPDDAAIAKTILVLAQTLGLEALAEGIETLEQWEFLARSGCRDYQGYYFSRPLPLAAFESFLINQAAARLALDTVS
jgi:diguanylate cyclase (GGDEF)-like protein